MKNSDFGNYFRALRTSLGKTLRQFSLDNGFDPGNISKLERGIFSAPHSEEKLEEYAAALRLRDGSDEWIKFFDLAALSNRNLSHLKLKNPDLIKRLPVLFRTLDNKEITEEKLDKIIEIIEEA